MKNILQVLIERISLIIVCLLITISMPLIILLFIILGNKFSIVLGKNNKNYNDNSLDEYLDVINYDYER